MKFLRSKNNVKFLNMLPVYWVFVTIILLFLTIRLKLPDIVGIVVFLLPWFITIWIMLNTKCPKCGVRTARRVWGPQSFKEIKEDFNQPLNPWICRGCGFKYDI